MNSYRELDIYKEAYQLALEVHQMSLKLPKYELYELGSQIRRSSKSIKDYYVDGFGRRRYKLEFIKFLVYSQISCDETIDHLRMISDIHHPKDPHTELIDEYSVLRNLSSILNYRKRLYNCPIRAFVKTIYLNTVMPDPDPASPAFIMMGDFTTLALRVQKMSASSAE